MKKVMIVLSMMASLAAFAQGEKYSFENLVGSWRNKSGAGLDIVDSATIYIVNGGQRKLATASFIDFNRNPFTLNLSVKETAKVVTLKSLLLFVNDNTLQWQVFDTDTKPVNFRGSTNDLMYLKKIRELEN